MSSLVLHLMLQRSCITGPLCPQDDLDDDWSDTFYDEVAAEVILPKEGRNDSLTSAKGHSLLEQMDPKQNGNLLCIIAFQCYLQVDSVAEIQTLVPSYPPGAIQRHWGSKEVSLADHGILH